MRRMGTDGVTVCHRDAMPERRTRLPISQLVEEEMAIPRTSRETKLRAGMCGAAALVIWALWFLPSPVSTHSDSTMIENFRRHEADFNRLAELIQQDAGVSAICSTVDAHRYIPPERQAEYVALLGAVDVRHGITREPYGQVLFRYWSKPATGFFDQYLEKGYAPLDTPPSRLVESLDDLSGLDQGLTYRPIDDRWYLYYYNRDSLPSRCDLRG
jgi:hypothetical protein